MESPKKEAGLSNAVEGITPYKEGEKSGQVEAMFDTIAPRYDLMNALMTFGMHRRWRDTALDMAARMVRDPDRETCRILDVATGTGDVAFEMLRRFPEASVEGIDLSEGMMEVASRKAAALPVSDRKRISFRQGDSLDLPYGEATFDLVTVAYGVRNFAHLEKGLAEMARVLRKGGVLCIVELSEPANPLLHLGYRIYTRTLIPAAGGIVTGDRRAYTYLPQSIAAVPQREAMALLMRRAGLSDTSWRSLTFGAVTIYLARK